MRLRFEWVNGIEIMVYLMFSLPNDVSIYRGYYSIFFLQIVSRVNDNLPHPISIPNIVSRHHWL